MRVPIEQGETRCSAKKQGRMCYCHAEGCLAGSRPRPSPTLPEDAEHNRNPETCKCTLLNPCTPACYEWKLIVELQKWRKLFKETQGVDDAIERQTTAKCHYNEGSNSKEDPSDEDSGDSETREDEGETEAEDVE